jgi:hypothetical protein
VLSLVMPFLKDSKAALSDGMQPVPPSWKFRGCGAPAVPQSGADDGKEEHDQRRIGHAHCMNSTYFAGTLL